MGAPLCHRSRSFLRIMLLRLLLQIRQHLPDVIGDAFRNPGAAKRFEPTNVGNDGGLRILVRSPTKLRQVIGRSCKCPLSPWLRYCDLPAFLGPAAFAAAAAIAPAVDLNALVLGFDGVFLGLISASVGLKSIGAIRLDSLEPFGTAGARFTGLDVGLAFFAAVLGAVTTRAGAAGTGGGTTPGWSAPLNFAAMWNAFWISASIPAKVCDRRAAAFQASMRRSF